MCNEWNDVDVAHCHIKFDAHAHLYIVIHSIAPHFHTEQQPPAKEYN